MKLRISHILSFTLVLAMAVPAMQAISMSDADAAPGGILSESRRPGRRVHKAKEAQSTRRSSSKKDDDKKKRKSSSSPQATGQPRRTNTAPRPTTTRTTHSTTTRSARPAPTHHARPQGPARATGRTRPARTSRPSTTTHRRGTSVRSTRSSHSHTEVHHHHYDDSSGRQVSTARRVDYDDSPSTVEGYFTLGLGLGGFAAGQIVKHEDGVDSALPGFDWNLGIGAKGSLFGAELGIHGGAYSLGSEPGESSKIDLTMVGLSLDLKLQPSFSVFEPYVLAGFGGYSLQDGELQETAGGGAFRLGAGADFRFNNFSIGARYLFAAYSFSNLASYHDLNVQTESIGINATFYF